ncbi:DUF5058 family protein [Lachnospiraceae bacterium NSJ-143]|nr:DUF5058 family protein [Lachnospiraceae bacterium NSJ-143]
MNPEILKIANDPMLWVMCSVIVIVAVVQSVLYTRISQKAAKIIKMDSAVCSKAFKTGLITAIGPSIGIFIVMVGMMSVIGGPMSWQRLSVIGSAPLELSNAQVGATVAGQTFGGADYNIKGLVLSFLTLALGTQGWIWFVILFGHKLEKVRNKIGGNDTKWLILLSTAAMVGVFGKLCMDKVAAGAGPAVAGVSAVIFMVILNKFIIPKFPILKEYAVGIVMLVAMVVASIIV